MSTPAIEAHGVSKTFLIPHEQRTTLREYIQHPLRRSSYERNDALQDVSVTIETGEFFGVVGANGSGKSTLLKILAGIYRPDSGNVAVNGLLSPFIELGVGFNFELNARDNIRLTGTLLGLSNAELRDRFDEILAFAELERFVDQKLKNYSSGMLLRLAYSIAIQVPFDILLLDEVLAVGDSNFQAKCFDTFERFRAEGKTIVFVSHDLVSVTRFCDRALWLENGVVRGLGDPSEVIDTYRQREMERLFQSEPSVIGGRSVPIVTPQPIRERTPPAGSHGVATATKLAPSDPFSAVDPETLIDPVEEFRSDHYLRHNQRRQEHLASIGLPLWSRTVLEVGAGIGDHTGFFLDRGCTISTSDGRPENFDLLSSRYSWIDVRLLDLDYPDSEFTVQAEIVYCYGVFNHLSRPTEALAFLAAHCQDLFLLETCVAPGGEESVSFVAEPREIPSQSLHGIGCRPTRPWVARELQRHFPHVYLPITQPWHPEFPLDWTDEPESGLVRAVFVASRSRLDNPLLSTEVPDRQVHH